MAMVSLCALVGAAWTTTPSAALAVRMTPSTSSIRMMAAPTSSTAAPAATAVLESLDGKVVPTKIAALREEGAASVARRAAAGEWLLTVAKAKEDAKLPKKPELPQLEDPAGYLQRYLQLRSVLEGEPLPDEVVSVIIEQVEAAHPPAPFDEATIWGDWQLVWQQNTASATNSQKALAAKPQFSNFMMSEYGSSGKYGGYTKKVFRNVVHLTRQRARVIADVEYTPPTADAEPPNRLGSTICKASLEIALGKRLNWKPLKIPLPLKGVGHLDILYLSKEMRITRGSRGGVFVHLRPEMLTPAAVVKAA